MKQSRRMFQNLISLRVVLPRTRPTHMHMPRPRTRIMGADQRKFQKCGAIRSKFRCGE